MSETTTQQTGYPRIALYIDGRWIHDRPSWSEVRNPSTEAALGPVPAATPQDLQAALAAADRGFRTWRDTPPLARAEVIQAAMRLLRDRKASIARTITLELGKPYPEALSEVERCATFFEWDCAQALRAHGTITPTGPGLQEMVLRRPIGPVASFTPWNVPIGAPARKISAALAAGCSLILKAAEETPGAATELVRCFADAGLPAGVLNLVFGDPALISSTLVPSPVIRLVAFTGSIPVGKHLAQMAAAAMKPVLMELGGHASVIVCDDVDPVRVARMAAAVKVRMTGQYCLCAGRFIVAERLYPAFVEALGVELRKVKVGDGFQQGVQMGPVANARRLAFMQALVADAKERGARIVTGGDRIGQEGYFFAPTLLADLPRDARAMLDEPFGPVAACVPVSSLDDAIALTNSLPYGLGAYAFTNSLENAERLGREIDTGVVSINNFGTPAPHHPFGGVKESGVGREGGESSLDSYLVSKTILQSTARI
ncbi:MAG TPA: NAD-dependent succinate-semialdehyde dehydrogenase [Ramlibacter sp.]|nr:NAD-dependent succinate-semialdehyde dehydrogenase [Ramlibacter sp.]